jgi:hypothetical protein
MPFCSTALPGSAWCGCCTGARECETDQTTVLTPRIIVLSSCLHSRVVSAALLSPASGGLGAPGVVLTVEDGTIGAAAGPPSAAAAAALLALSSSSAFLVASTCARCLGMSCLSVANLETRQCRMRTSSARPSGSLLWKMFSTRLSSSRTEVVWMCSGSVASWMLHEKM